MILLVLLLQDVRSELAKLASPDLEVRQAAETALVAMGEAAIPEIERLAAAADLETRARAADVVRRLRVWDHVVYFRGRKIDLRRGTAQAADFAPSMRAAGGRLLDATRAVDLRTGRELWRREAPGEIWGLEANEASVLVRTPKGLACLDAADGRALWTSAGFRFEALAGGDWLVAEGAELSRKGATSWTVKAQPAHLAAAGPWAFAAGAEASTRVLDVRNGMELRTLEDLSVRRAVDGGEGRVVVVEGRGVTALRTSDFSRLWTRPNVREATRLLVDGRRLYVADHHAMCCSIRLYALDVETGAPIWTAPARGIPAEHSKYRHDARLARVGPYLVLTGEAAAGDYVEAFDPATGALVSRWTSN